MTIQTNTITESFICDGVGADYVVNYPVLEKDDIVVTHEDNAGVKTLLVLGTDYTVILETNYENGCTVTTNTVYPSNDKITVERIVDILQLTDYIEGSRFPADQTERALDKLTMITQQLNALKPDKDNITTDATKVRTDTTNFNNNLSTDDDNVQKCLDKIDDLQIQQGSAEWGQIIGTLSNQTDLQNELDNRFKKSEHVDSSAGASDAGKPIVLGADGYIDESMLTVEGWTYIGDFTPMVGSEYPDTTGVPNASFWTVIGVGNGYTFATGDLAGQTVTVGDYMLWGTSGWAIRQSTMDPDAYYKRDGSQPITAPFAGGGQQVKNIVDGTEDTDGATVKQLNEGLETKEDELGNPSVDGQILSSDVSGTRQWIDQSHSGGVDEATVMMFAWLCK